MPAYANIKEERPTLPSIHTLNLPLLKRNANNEFSRHERHVSTSSTATSSSRSTSPESATSSMSHTTQFRLVPCPLENATALVITSPMPQPTSPSSNYSSHGKMGRGVLIMGEKVRDIRTGRRPIARGARVHPYRLALPENRDSSSPSHRRSSVISVSSYSP
ncbi:hypothetical protein D9619_007954 [Psilocybe cf. subviscida]|uniref:Uncharacterized protein n=1 Tax=Psilocybe cf. subviscida TaxID=2480587 RepID=A0A8H5ATN6_9AGAR|nr:hypothetical protein D9619_007954 [Psilocybe cf. subviscida]